MIGLLLIIKVILFINIYQKNDTTIYLPDFFPSISDKKAHNNNILFFNENKFIRGASDYKNVMKPLKCNPENV